MAFYDQAPGKKKRVSYGELGSWDEEGSHYQDGKKGRSRSAAGTTSGKTYGKAVGKKEDSFGRPTRSSRDSAEKGSYRSAPSGRKTGGKDAPRSQSGKREPFGRNADRRDSGRGNSGRKGPFERDRDWREPFEAESAERTVQDFRDYEFRGGTADRAAGQIAEPENILIGRNPIREALKSDRDIEKLLVQKGELSGTAREIVAVAREKKIMVQEVEKTRLDEIAPHHQGMIAFASAYAYAEVEDMLELARQRGEAPFLILLDGVTDPHNLGAIIRTAECTGAHGVIVPLHRSVGLTPAAVKASAGAIEHIPVARVTNLNRTIDELKKQGIWVYAVTMGAKDYEETDFRDGTALVIGAEGEGISKLTLAKCDQAVSLPMKGALDSLNASVAAGVIMYRVLSCRRKR